MEFRSAESWASQLAAWLDTNPIDQAYEQLFGLYSALRLDPDGAGMAATDLLGGGVLYHGENARWFALSSRAGLTAAAAVDFEIVPERIHSPWAGWSSGTCPSPTIRVLGRHPPAVQSPDHLWPERRGADRKTRPPVLASPGTESHRRRLRCPARRAPRRCARELRTIARLPVDDFELRLSGGKDSRMLAVILHDEGLADRFRFLSYGLPNQADVRGAELVADKLGLRWTFESRGGISPQEEELRLRRHAFLVEGTTNGWDNTAVPLPSRGVSLSGIGGECTSFGPTATAGLSVRSLDEVKQLYAVKETSTSSSC